MSRADQGVAVVSGAASGIGAAVADTLRQSGWKVAGIDLRPSDTDFSSTTDVTDVEAVNRAVTLAEDALGPITALVSAAGYYEANDIDEISEQAWNRMLRVHLGGLVNTARAVLPGMLSRQAGSIVAVTSELALSGGVRDAHYVAAKGAIIGLVRTLAVEMAPKGIRVNAVAPGPTDTPLLEPSSPWRDPQYLATLPVRRLARPQEIAVAVRFLIDDASFLVGEVISVNSGAVI